MPAAIAPQEKSDSDVNTAREAAGRRRERWMDVTKRAKAARIAV